MRPNMLSLLKASVDKHHESEAVVHGKTRISYEKIWQGVLQVKNNIRSHGLKEGDRVALMLGNFPKYIMAYYGILSASGVVELNAAA